MKSKADIENKPTDNNQLILQNYTLMLQNEFTNNSSPLLSNNIYTHLGLYIKTLKRNRKTFT